MTFIRTRFKPEPPKSPQSPEQEQGEGNALYTDEVLP